MTAPARGPHVPTLCLGLVLAGVAVGFGVTQLSDVQIDLALMLPVGMVALGALLVLGAVLTGLRRGR